MDTPRVDVSHPADGVAVLLMDNGPMNFGNARLHDLMEEALTEARDNGTLVMVLASAVPGYFLAHGHIGEIVGTMTGTAASDGDPRAFLRLQKELDTGPMVSLAAIEGQAWGGGAELAWSCDFRVASESSTLGQPEILVGLPPAGGATRMSRIAGEAAARRLVLDGRPVSAREAFRLGLVDMLVGKLRTRCRCPVGDLACGPTSQPPGPGQGPDRWQPGHDPRRCPSKGDR